MRVRVDLGDSVYGPLDPAGTARRLRALTIPHVRGNQDRVLVDTGAKPSRTAAWVLDQLGSTDRAWLRNRSPAVQLAPDVLACHRIPTDDEAYLLEIVRATGVQVRDPRPLARHLAGVSASLVLCGHSHVPRTVAAEDGVVVVNPGSVGLPAFEDAVPVPHAMEAGSPHARYAIVERGEVGWMVEHVAVPYDWNAAAGAASRRGRDDWAGWLRSGRRRPT